MRKAVVIAMKSRRGIPLHWNERYQGKRKFYGDSTVCVRSEKRKIRSKMNQQIASFHGDWEDFIPLMFKHDYID